MENNCLELSRKQLREKALSRIMHVRTCVLARELCLIVRTNRAVFTRDDVEKHCSYISQLCIEAGCVEQGKLCKQASRAVKESEERYLELCQQSCLRCGEAKRPRAKKNTSYVA
jgi:hypothetical protein